MIAGRRARKNTLYPFNPHRAPRDWRRNGSFGSLDGNERTSRSRPEADRELVVPHAAPGTSSSPNIDPNIGHGLRRIVTNASEHTVKEINYNSMGSKQLQTIMDEGLAERVGFEPTIRFWRILTFQASAFDHSATAPHCSGARALAVHSYFRKA